MPQRLESLTALRFFAAFLIVLGHHLALAPQVSGGLLDHAYVGVTFFFLLSGFVLTWSQQPDDTPGAFLWRRFARVWPLHALLWLVVLATLPQPAGSSAGTIVANLLLLQSWSTDPLVYASVNGVAWSLSNEAFFYVMFPLLAAVLPFGRARIASVAGVLIAAMAVCSILFSAWTLYIFPPYRIGEFIIGMLLARAISAGWRPQITLARAGWATVILYVAVASSGLERDWADMAMLPAFALLIGAAARADLSSVRTWLSSPVLVRLGQWSFALYLIHYPLFSLCRQMGFGGLGAYVAAIVLAVALSGVAYTVFERPVERRLRAIQMRRTARRGEPELAAA